eukprot:1157596-Pelagomonas_calceolata.AAC.11
MGPSAACKQGAHPRTLAFAITYFDAVDARCISAGHLMSPSAACKQRTHPRTLDFVTTYL